MFQLRYEIIKSFMKEIHVNKLNSLKYSLGLSEKIEMETIRIRSNNSNNKRTVELAFIHAYSYLRASMGFSCAAFLAGYMPKTIPTRAENRKATIMDSTDISVGQPVIVEATLEISIPVTVPIAPPTRERSTDFNQKLNQYVFSP